MKNTLFSFAGFMLSILMLSEKKCENSSLANSKTFAIAILPMAVGNQWIYLDSVFLQGKLMKTNFDTLRILKSGNQNGAATFIFSDGKELSENGDTIFQWVSQRSGVKFPTTYFIKSEDELKYNYVFGGDVIMERTVSRMKNCISKDCEGSACYTVKDRCNAETVFATGIGVMRERTTDCFGGEKSYSIRTLQKFIPSNK
jgi:hypothetical protein